MLARNAYDHRSVAQSKVRIADRFLGEITERLQIIDPKNFEAQELRGACTTLRTARAEALRVLQEIPETELSPQQEQRRLRNEAIEATELGTKLVFIDKLRAQGDFRQARVHILSTLQLRHQIEKESSL